MTVRRVGSTVRAAATWSILWACQVASVAARDDVTDAVEHILAKAREQQTADLEAWRLHAFDRQVVRQRLDKEGRTYWQETLRFRVSPTPEGFHEHLESIDGHAPSSRQYQSHLNAGRFAERYRELLQGNPDDTQDGYSLRSLLEMSAYRYEGLEEKEGQLCHRLEFEPGPPKSGGIARRIADVSSGTLWLSEPGWHLVAAEAATSRRISLALGVARIQRLQVSYLGAPLNPRIWLPKRIEVRTDLRLLGRNIRKRNVFTYGRFGAASP